MGFNSTFQKDVLQPNRVTWPVNNNLLGTNCSFVMKMKYIEVSKRVWNLNLTLIRITMRINVETHANVTSDWLPAVLQQSWQAYKWRCQFVTTPKALLLSFQVFRYGDSQYKDKPVVRPSYFHNVNTYADKMVSLYRNGVQASSSRFSILSRYITDSSLWHSTVILIPDFATL